MAFILLATIPPSQLSPAIYVDRVNSECKAIVASILSKVDQSAPFINSTLQPYIGRVQPLLDVELEKEWEGSEDNVDRQNRTGFCKHHVAFSAPGSQKNVIIKDIVQCTVIVNIRQNFFFILALSYLCNDTAIYHGSFSNVLRTQKTGTEISFDNNCQFYVDESSPFEGPEGGTEKEYQFTQWLVTSIIIILILCCTCISYKIY